MGDDLSGRPVQPFQEPPLNYPSMEPPRERAPRPPRPSAVTYAAGFSVLAVACWIALTLTGGGGAITFTSSRVVQTGPNTYETYATTGPAPLGLLVGIAVVVGALWLVLVFLMYRGQNWSRILLTIFGCLGIAGELVTVLSSALAAGAGTVHVAGDILTALVCGLVIVALVMMFRESSNTYFRRR